MNEKKFDYISREILPSYFQVLTSRKKSPLSMSSFYERGTGETEIFRSIKTHFGIQSKIDFPACYLFSENQEDLYVGITKSISTRIR
ncbi:hypothetical protein CH370_19795 [Leptospira kmetyi]|uniref:Uncharacterized protein n=1 Tax=Leptospira kmetyi TaxID=408139 RepID=A0ABX4N5I4_9LEPT|nr:hypothetical protein CH378_20805 [Leptospira kmetyi]PJZ39699.1 hypothetical protein CH370_19795 [Leptospira kmetyi]